MSLANVDETSATTKPLTQFVPEREKCNIVIFLYLNFLIVYNSKTTNFRENLRDLFLFRITQKVKHFVQGKKLIFVLYIKNNCFKKMKPFSRGRQLGPFSRVSHDSDSAKIFLGNIFPKQTGVFRLV